MTLLQSVLKLTFCFAAYGALLGRLEVEVLVVAGGALETSEMQGSR